jgi:Rap1a immunity proteins
MESYNMKRWIAITALLVCFNANAETKAGTVGALLEACLVDELTTIDKSYNQGFCIGTFLASLRYLLVIQERDTNYFIPNEVTTGQLKAVFIKWAKEHPEQWHEASHVGVVQAVMQNFPRSK